MNWDEATNELNKQKFASYGDDPGLLTFVHRRYSLGEISQRQFDELDEDLILWKSYNWLSLNELYLEWDDGVTYLEERGSYGCESIEDFEGLMDGEEMMGLDSWTGPDYV